MSPIWLAITMYTISTLLIAWHTWRPQEELFLITSTTVLAASLFTALTTGSFYSLMLLAGMGASLVGDLFMKRRLRMTSHKIIDGIVAFAVAHLFYLCAVTVQFGTDILTSVMYAVPITGVFFFTVIYDGEQRSLSFAALVYALLICTLFISSLFAHLSEWSLTTIVLLLGTILFVSSDSMIAYRQFREDHPSFEKYISLTYIVAQILIQGHVLIA